MRTGVKNICPDIPADRFVEHGERHELLHDLGLDEAGLMATILKLTEKAKTLKPKAWTKERTA